MSEVRIDVPERGRADNPKSIGDDDVIRLPTCPDCEGRGWFLINPFATGGAGGAGGRYNMTQCRTCFHAHEHWQKHGTLPSGLEHPANA